MGFAINEKKTRVLRQSQRQTVTGVVVNQKPQAPASYRRQIRQERYYCKNMERVPTFSERGSRSI